MRRTVIRLLVSLAPALLLLLLAPAVALAQDVDTKAAAKLIDVFRPAGIIPAIIVLTVAIVGLRVVTGLTSRLGERFTERRLLAHQVNTIMRFAIYLVAIVLVTTSLLRLERETVLALAGTVAVAFGFAFKDLAASLLAGITILFDRPFQVGDRVTFDKHYGEIKTIGLRSVRMVTLDDSVVTIPNNKFLTDVVVSGNTGELFMMVVMDFYAAQDADIPLAKRVVSEAVRTSRFVYAERPVVVLVNDVVHDNYLTTRLRAKAYVLDVRYEKAFETDVTERVKAAFGRHRISLPSIVHRPEAA